MGQIIQINGGMYDFLMPSVPRREQDILYYDLPKKQQYWRTPHDVKKQLQIRDVRKMTTKEAVSYIDMWRERWLEGMWFFSNGEPKHLTGLHMEHLVFNTYNSGKLLYFDQEREIFYFIKHSDEAKECTGRTWVKPRRAKMTTIMCSLAQRNLIRDFSNYVTIQSDTLDKARKSYMQPIIDSYVRRPAWMREEYYAPNGKKPQKALELKSTVIRDPEDEPMGGWINIYPALAKATDGLEAVQTIQDEFSKVTESSPYETFEVNRKVTQNFRKQGMNDCLSSSGDSKDAVKATMDWHKLIAQSDPQKIDVNGKSMSGNWEFFISAVHSQYVPKEFTDIYGVVDVARAEEYIWTEHNKYQKGTKEYIYSLYKLPLEKAHALLSSSASSIFRKPAISARLSELDSLRHDEKPYVIGRLDESKDGMNVDFVPDPTGIWRIAILPYFDIQKGIDTRNRFLYIDGIFHPPINQEGCIGYDPINYPKHMLKSTHYSQAAATAHKKFDYFGAGDADQKTAMFNYRPDDPHEANYEVIKYCKWTGFRCMHESSIAHVYDDFEKYKMLPFLMTDDDGKYGIRTSTGPATRNGVAMLQSRYKQPKGLERDQIMDHPFEDNLRSHLNFDISNTGAFDPTMSEIIMEHGLKQLQFTNQTDQTSNDMARLMREIQSPRH